MDTVKINKKSTLLIAHRGLSGIEKENTCSAFVAAANRSYYGIETDIHPALDGELVISHDNNLSRVSNNIFNCDVEKCSWNQLKEITLPDRDSTTNRIDLRLPRLIDYVRICKRYEKKCIIEIKGIFSRENLEKTVNLIKEENYLDKTVFISFGLENCVILKEMLPNQQIQLLSDFINEDIISQLVKYNLDLDVKYSCLKKEVIDELHSKGIKVNCFTCNSKEDAEQLIDWGIDFITSNILE